MAIERVYFRHKVEGKGWRYAAVTAGRQTDAAKKGPFFIRVRNLSGKYQWQRHSTRDDANKAREVAPVERKAAALGLINSDELSAVNRTAIKVAAENYLTFRKVHRPRSQQNYNNIINLLLANLPAGVRFVDQLAKPAAMASYVEFLVGKGYAPKTVAIHMGLIFSLLKANGIEKSSTLVKLPKYERTRVKAYNPSELAKLFAEMTPQEYLQYLFFVRTGCREQEVQFATWNDLDFSAQRYTVTGKGKADVGFVPKSHEAREVPLTTELVKLLKEYKKKAPSDRWIFVNTEGNPNGHALRGLKRIAKRAGMNCGQCRTTVREGRYDNRKEVPLSCATTPTCAEHYLHRLRKTAATNWLRAGFDARRIQHWLGHKSLEVTQLYLDAGMHDSDEQAKLDRAGKF
jgi:integrase/recombinase XerD